MEILEQLLEDIATLPDEELIDLPTSNVPPGLLSAIWARTSSMREDKEQKGAEIRDYQHQLARRDMERYEREVHEDAVRRYVQTIRMVEERSGDLEVRVAEEEVEAREHLREIEQRAIVLQDGRRVYVGRAGDYLDGNGDMLQGEDKLEAHSLHLQNPKAATWAEKTEAEHQAEALRQLKEKVEKLHNEAGREDGKGLSADQLDARCKDYAGRLSGFEKEFQDQKERRTAALAAGSQITDETYGGSNYMADYAATDRKPLMHPSSTMTPAGPL